ncbi:MAG: acetyl/propionyl-CoA carboxylase alpha subunit [Limisphaerales bacterium]|jgi:acetyl/propionyl-CoA carboxylase alpha subunit
MKSIKAVLIANRGEIASRIIRTCKKMGIKTIAVYSEADCNSLYVNEADVAVHIGDPAPADSYLDQDKLFAAAKTHGADAIHPGYGFLAEHAGFARRCAKEGLIFIGPNPEAIDAMGSKSNAKTLMLSHDVPVVPGYQGPDQSTEKLKAEALKIGFPLLLKATAGGGGKGMRIVEKPEALESAIAAAKRESASAFGNDELIIEKYITSGRHIEFQIFGDKHGNTIHILERECTIQRRYQKVLEESPSPVMDQELRDKMGAAAVNAAKALNYDNAGTVEFIYDDITGAFYFLEVNTRLQVEHPVTEAITGLDLVALQIESAEGKELHLTQAEIKGKGYALEARLYAEDAQNNFMPVTGKVTRFEVPDVDGLRIESAIKTGSEISIWYDPMIAKIIVHGKDRVDVHRKMCYTLNNLICQGITTNQQFLLDVLSHSDFITGNYDTHFISRMVLDASTNNNDHAAIAACIYEWNIRNKNKNILASIPSGWRNNYSQAQETQYQIGTEIITVLYRNKKTFFDIKIKDNSYKVELKNNALEIDGVQLKFTITEQGNRIDVHQAVTGNCVLNKLDRFPVLSTEDNSGGYEAPMPCSIIDVLVKPGQEVKSGEGLVILSSMKMENTIEAAEDGTVEEIYAEKGSNVEAGFVLLKMTTK